MAPRAVAALAAAAFLALPLAALPATIHVPGDQPTIQAGIDAAAPGDTVEVACGTYNEHDLGLTSGVTLRSETGDPGCVTVDARNLGRVILCTDADATTALVGITLTGGNAGHGAGLWCHNSSPAITDCIFVGNTATFDGGGLESEGLSSPVITRCSFSMNHASNCGGGLAHDNGSSTPEAPTLRQCDFFGNSAGNCGGGLGVGAGVGGSLVVEDCTFRENQAMDGGGLYCWNEGTGELVVSRSTFRANSALRQGGGTYTGQGPSVSISDCLFWENTASTGGGMMLVDAGEIRFCTFTANEASLGGGVAFHLPSDASATFANTIVWGNSAPAGSEVHYWSNAPAALLTFSCCDVRDAPGSVEIAGPGGLDMSDANFSADPLFCDPEAGDFTLHSSSPCLPGNHPDGADCGLIGALGQGCGPVSVERESWGRIKGMYR
jgi:hypothetical protein